jgi:DNA-binding MarR family transcriptional regulator
LKIPESNAILILVPIRSNKKGVVTIAKSIKEDIKKYYDLWFTFNNIYDRWAKMHGLTVNTLFVYYTIHENEGVCTQQVISERLQLPKQTVNSILKIIQKNGYIQMTADKNDKRNKLICFTPYGKHYTEKLMGALYNFEENAFIGMDYQQRKNMLEGTEILIENLLLSYEKERHFLQTTDLIENNLAREEK